MPNFIYSRPLLMHRLKQPLTFEDFTAMCEADGAEPPTLEEFGALQAAAAHLEGRLGRWEGMIITSTQKVS